MALFLTEQIVKFSELYVIFSKVYIAFTLLKVKSSLVSQMHFENECTDFIWALSHNNFYLFYVLYLVCALLQFVK